MSSVSSVTTAEPTFDEIRESFLKATRELESANKLANIATIQDVQKQIEGKFKEIAEATAKMKRLRELLAQCNQSTDKEGTLDFTKIAEDQKEKFSATLADFSIDEPDLLDKSLNNFEREKLIDTIKMKMEDIDLPNKTAFLQVQSCLNLRNEAYLSARTNSKSMDDVKKRMAGNIAKG